MLFCTWGWFRFMKTYNREYGGGVGPVVACIEASKSEQQWCESEHDAHYEIHCQMNRIRDDSNHAQSVVGEDRQHQSGKSRGYRQPLGKRMRHARMQKKRHSHQTGSHRVIEAGVYRLGANRMCISKLLSFVNLWLDSRSIHSAVWADQWRSALARHFSSS